MKVLLAVLGVISLILGVIGIFLPLLPTIPFVLLSAYLFSKSSSRMHNWIINHNVFGQYVRNYHEDKSIPLQAKIMAISTLWISMLFGIFYVAKDKLWLQLLLLTVAVAVTIFLALIKIRKVIK